MKARWVVQRWKEIEEDEADKAREEVQAKAKRKRIADKHFNSWWSRRGRKRRWIQRNLGLPKS
jgi:hypothetical protein